MVIALVMVFAFGFMTVSFLVNDHYVMAGVALLGLLIEAVLAIVHYRNLFR
jgi:hypothetical protein